MIKIYEVIALENNLPLFFNRHLRRFHQSISAYKKISFLDLRDIIINILKPKLDKIEYGFNLKVLYTVEDDSFLVSSIITTKPSKDEYINGGHVGLFNGERNTPLIKRENLSFREQTETYCKQQNYYDVLLVNNLGYITEGSKSNFLLIENSSIITSPIGDSLNGITREVIFEICKEENIQVRQERITPKRLESIECLLITGTTPEIFPIINCEGYTFNINNAIINKLKSRFKQKKLEDLAITAELFK